MRERREEGKEGKVELKRDPEALRKMTEAPVSQGKFDSYQK